MCLARLAPPFFFFFNDTATTEIYTLSLHDALPISRSIRPRQPARTCGRVTPRARWAARLRLRDFAARRDLSKGGRWDGVDRSARRAPPVRPPRRALARRRAVRAPPPTLGQRGLTHRP